MCLPGQGQQRQQGAEAQRCEDHGGVQEWQKSKARKGTLTRMWVSVSECEPQELGQNNLCRRDHFSKRGEKDSKGHGLV